MSVSLSKGTQILYIPHHMKDIHDNVIMPIVRAYPNGAQPGFVTSAIPGGKGHFCRYWQLDEDGNVLPILRTKSNSEFTPSENLYLYTTVPPEWVANAIEEIEKGKGE